VVSAIALLLAFSLTQSEAPPQPDLSLILRCGEQPNELALTIQNSGQTDTAVLIGIALANGRWYLPRELVVDLRRSGSAEVEQLVYRGPTGVAGRIDHWVVALPVRATFTVLLRSTDFVSTTAATVATPPTELTVRLTGRPITSDLNVDMTGMKAWRLWTGSASSNTVRLSDCSA
jgi:hypothetical protein